MDGKLGVVGIVGVPGRYGGFETMTDQVLPLSLGSETLVYSEKSMHYSHSHYKGARLVRLPLSANGVSSLFYDSLGIFHACFSKCSVILALGVSGAWCFPLVRMFFPKVRLICNIDGVESARGKWGFFAAKLLANLEFIAVKFANIIVADNSHLAVELKRKYGISPRVIEYGGDHVMETDTANIDLPTDLPLDSRFALCVCRIEPENNIEMILEAFAGGDTNLIFVGNWCSSVFGVRMRDKFGGEDNLWLLDPIYDAGVLHDLRGRCDIYVHGHSAGGTNPSLVEIMFYSCSLLCFDVAYNRCTVDGNAQFFSSAEDLSKKTLVKEEKAVIERRIKLAQSQYTWARIRECYFEVFCEK